MKSSPGPRWRNNNIRFFAGLFLLLVTFFFETPSAFAQTHTTGRFAAWETFEGRSSQGRYLCGMVTRGQGKSLMIKHFQNDDFFTIQVFNDDWRVPRVTEVAVALRLGNQFNSGRLRGEAHPAIPPVSAVVEVSIPYEGSGGFWTAFRWANVGYLDFLTGNEGSWSISLTGSNAATLQHLRCIEGRGFARQPFSSTPGEKSPSETFPSNQSPSGGRKSPF
jgi:hypothetical protein